MKTYGGTLDTIDQIQKWKQFVDVRENRHYKKRLRHERMNSLKALEYIDKSGMARGRGSNKMDMMDLASQERAMQHYMSKNASIADQSRKTAPAGHNQAAHFLARRRNNQAYYN